MNKGLSAFLRSNVVPICLFPKKSNIQNYDTDFQVIGTGFNIATFGKEALIITASHLSDSFVESFDSNRHKRAKFFPETVSEDILFDLDEAHVFFNVGSSSCMKADIVKAGLSDKYDIGFMNAKFRHPDHTHLSQIEIDSAKLNIGQKVFIFAYSNLKYSTGAKINFPPSTAPFDLEDVFYHKFDGDIETIHEGEIVNIHNEFRGCRYEVNIPVESGMSGGLVFYLGDNNQPIALGVVSSSHATSSTSPETSEGEGCFVTPIGDILNVPLIDNGKFLEYHVLSSNEQLASTHEIKTLKDFVKLGVIVDVSHK